MHRPDRFDDGPALGPELPDLPIPRPGEGPAEHVATPPLAAPRLGGGASFTAAAAGETAAPSVPPAPTPPAEDPERERVEAERFTWELAARLTAGMLANPARNHASVKDAMAMFDQFLQEMHAYTRISSEIAPHGGVDGDRRRHHTEYFQGPTPSDEASAAPSKPKPEPAKPRPLPGYQPLPPGARSYVPGSMAGAPPPHGESAPGQDGVEDAAA